MIVNSNNTGIFLIPYHNRLYDKQILESLSGILSEVKGIVFNKSASRNIFHT